MRIFFTRFLIVLLSVVLCQCGTKTDNRISLAGTWHVALDSLNVGEAENWPNTLIEGTEVELPGTLDDAGIGEANTMQPAINNYVMSNLARKHYYTGKAWYQKKVTVPTSWKGKEIALILERIIWESNVFVDGKKVGAANSLIGSHEYNLTDFMSPGEHILTISIDNSNKFPLVNVAGSMYPDERNRDMAHAYTNHTQIKWNGILGDMVLKASDKSTPSNLQVYPKVEENALQIAFDSDGADVPKQLEYEIYDLQRNIISKGSVDEPQVKNGTVSFRLERPEQLEFWDEFNPALYYVKLNIGYHSLETRFGYKSIGNNNGNLTLNGKRIFLRGNLECVIFPLTGHPPMQKEEWAKLIGQAKNYGLNHLRFHSWCPPKAAFEAADEAGFYYQVELPHWSLRVGEDEKTTEFLKQEADKIIRDYGNHPSFVFMAMGNELQGDIGVLNEMTADLKKKDDRHLYATTSFSFQKPTGTRPEVEDEFFIAQWTDKGWIRGQGIFNDKAPHFNADYSENSDHIKIPLVSHEIGQYSVYPDLSEIPKYTGVLKPLNFMAVKNDLENKKLIDLAEDFTQASGKLAAILYKEEIERALKTPSFDGFQLLQLQDFPGQGTALVGLLNAFWESKGIISAEEFRQFNSEVVPLIRFEKAVYEDGEVFTASIEVANFYKRLQGRSLDWSIADEEGNILKEGALSNIDLNIGNNLDLGVIEYPINVGAAKKMTVNVSLRDSKYKNSWSFWGYPKNIAINSDKVVFAKTIEVAQTALKEGKKVLFNPDYKTLQGIEGRFVPVFWSPVHFPNQPATMGLLLDENHVAFDNFPTSSHTDWQWWDLCINSKSIVADSLNVTPLVRVIDNFVTNHHLTNVFEAKVGEGSLLFSAIDITNDLENRPVARQLRHSLIQYMESGSFDPVGTIQIDDLYKLKLQKEDKGFSSKDIYK
ncbi:glycoside hydrolase family 2 [Maribacter sp. MMG018]|uniref:sugar-binding domain-containing protein n=1 Tax=Maribacter sp. MMG018 TaxID=2822688 RepID=UPI001B37647A|nr:sugar-binding domain-containing protein [Maribacter sp. MMG018]MBQ4914192.1 glycoside hydrolase family 2 [Maribacter sp. MMG018]